MEVTDAARRQFAAAALICVVWAQTILPSTMESLTTSKRQLSLTTGDSVSTPLVALMERMFVYGQIALCIVIICLFLRSARADRGFMVVLAVLPYVYLAFRDTYIGAHPSTKTLSYPLLIVAIWVLRPRLRQLQLVGYLVIATAVISLLMGWFVKSAGILQSAAGQGAVSEDKQILGGGVLVGPFNHGNQLGGYLVVGIVSVALIENRRWRWFGYIVCTYALIWSAARSSLLTFGVLLVVAAILRVTAPRIRGAVGFGFVLAAGVAVCLTPVLTTNPTAFTNRGFIWVQVFKAWAANPTFGLGSSWFARTAGTSEIIANSAYQAHSEFLQLLTTGGVVLVVITAGLILAVGVVAAVRSRQEIYGFCFLIALLGSGWLEASFGFVDYYQLAAVIFIPIGYLLFTDDPVITDDQLIGDHPVTTEEVMITDERADMDDIRTTARRRRPQHRMPAQVRR